MYIFSLSPSLTFTVAIKWQLCLWYLCPNLMTRLGLKYRILLLLFFHFQIKYRTLRIGIANIFYSVAVPVGTALSGILFLKLGFYGVYTIAIVLYSFTIVYGVIFVKETNPKTSIEPPTGDTKSCTYFLKDFFSLSNVKEAIDVTFKKGQHNRRLRIVSLMVVVIVVMGPIYGS